jgi:hypothetical protein
MELKRFCSNRARMMKNEMALQHKRHHDEVCRERELHEDAYDKMLVAEALQKNNDRLRTTVVEQREEIKALLKRISRYAPQEFAGKIPGYMPGQEVDPAMWVLSRDAADEEEQIRLLKLQVKRLENDARRMVPVVCQYEKLMAQMAEA